MRFIPHIAAILHGLFCVALSQMPSEGSWRWFPAFVVDLPISILFFKLPDKMPPLIVFGVLGSAWWYFLLFGIIKGINKITKKKSAEDAHKSLSGKHNELD